MMNKKLRGLSLFAGAGIGEAFIQNAGVDIVVANELVPCRAALYESVYPECEMICGDISDESIFNKIITACDSNIDFIIASPPCQGMSVAGKNRKQNEMQIDKRNYLFKYVIKAIKALSPTYILVENVPMLLKFMCEYKNEECSIEDIFKNEFSSEYNIEAKILDSSDYGVPQTRLRAIIKMHSHNRKWNFPNKCTDKVTVKQAIGHLPSLEANEKSCIKWHFARNHSTENIAWMRHTPTGKSAFSNEVYFPKKLDGTRVKGYESSYRRIRWDAPAPTITIRNDCIASQRNVHPGHKLKDGTFSDARVLTPLELMLLSSLPVEWGIPEDTPELLIRQCIGESIPPLMIEKIVKMIWEDSV